MLGVWQKRTQAGLDGVRPANHPDNLTPQVMIMRETLTHKEKNLTVIGHIEGVPCPMVVDTGANITIVRPDVLTKTLLNSVQATTSVLKTATGEAATVHGKEPKLFLIGSTHSKTSHVYSSKTRLSKHQTFNQSAHFCDLRIRKK